MAWLAIPKDPQRLRDTLKNLPYARNLNFRPARLRLYRSRAGRKGRVRGCAPHAPVFKRCLRAGLLYLRRRIVGIGLRARVSILLDNADQLLEIERLGEKGDDS